MELKVPGSPSPEPPGKSFACFKGKSRMTFCEVPSQERPDSTMLGMECIGAHGRSPALKGFSSPSLKTKDALLGTTTWNRGVFQTPSC